MSTVSDIGLLRHFPISRTIVTATRAASLIGAAVTRVAGLALAVVLSGGGAVEAASLAGTASDATGGVLPGATVTLQNVATGAETTQAADGEGRFRFDGLPTGLYRLAVSLSGFSDDAKTVTIADPAAAHEVSFTLWPGGLSSEVTVTALRNARDEQVVPLRVDTLAREYLAAKNPTSTGDAMIQAPGITPVGNGPFQVRPRLRGLDSSRLLVLVDGERLNNARVATDRAGVEVSLADLGSVESMEVVSGSGSVLYGTDALSGTIDIVTNQPRLSDGLRFSYGFDGYFSSNEQGGRGTVTFGVSHPRYAVQVVGGIESFDDYKAGGDATSEDTRPLYAQGILTQADTIDDNFGFNFNAFPDPFNAPYVRTSTVVPTSGAEGNNLNASGLFAITGTQSLRVKYIRRRLENVGFPDFAQPYFFSRVTLPYSNFDRFSARYEVQGLTPWFTNLKVSGYVQDQKRLLRNEFPVQFPVPSPRFFPINVFRLDLVTDTEQHVFTPGFDVQGTFLFARHHVVTAGATLYQDRSQDSRANTSQTSIIGTVALGPRGPVATVFPSPVVTGPATYSNPVRVPDSQFRDLGMFVQDEWEVNRALRIVGGLRIDGYRVHVDATPGYDVESLIVGAKPPVDADTLPSVTGDAVSRTAFTGDLGAVFRVTDDVSVVAHYGRSYRHPNLEELLFSGPATVGAIVPNMTVEPETGHNVDVGIKWRSARYAASLAYFNNTYDGFISTEIVATTPRGPISQAINFADVRIQGVEAAGEVPFEFGPGVVTLFGNAAWTRGTVLEGTSPVNGESLAGTPQDNISPFKAIAGVRWADRRNRYWAEYGARIQTDVDRVARTLVESPYLIAQDLYGLQGFTVQRLACGVNFGPQSGRLGLVFAVENLTDAFYREQFQFAPARGRSFTLGLNVRGL